MRTNQACNGGNDSRVIEFRIPFCLTSCDASFRPSEIRGLHQAGGI